MKTNLSLLLVLVVFGAGGEMASAQVPFVPTAPRAPRPTLSPYLNLLDRNNSTSFNYYNRVRPRQAFDDYASQQYRNLSALEKRVDRNRQSILQQSENSELNPSGHTTRFLDLGGYFPAGAGGQQQFGGAQIGRR